MAGTVDVLTSLQRTSKGQLSYDKGVLDRRALQVEIVIHIISPIKIFSR